MVITRIDLARRLAPQLGVTHQHAERFLLAFMSEVSGALQRGDEVVLRGFGRFSPVRRKERTSRDPRTGAPVLVPPRTVARFKPYAVMTDLNPESED